MTRPAGSIALLVAAVAVSTHAAEHRILREESGFAVVTHRGGVAAGFAHDHLIVARDYRASLDFDAARPAATRFEFEVDAEQLAFDLPEEQARWFPLAQSLGVLDEPFKDIAPKQRVDIRATALGKKQLDAATYPRLSAAIVTVEPSDDATLPWRVALAFEVHGARVERPVAARFDVGADGRVTIEAAGSFRFSDFGIAPYSALLGAVRNKDEFDVLVRMVAVPDPAAPAAAEAPP